MKAIITAALLLTGICAKAQTGNIRVIIPGVKQAKGSVQICVYNSDETFLDGKKMYEKAVLKASVTKS